MALKRHGNIKLHKKQNSERRKASRIILRRTTIVMIVCGFLLFIPLVATLFKMMILEHDYYSKKALSNQTRTTSVSAARGTIYDRNMNVLAASSSVENVFIDPLEFKQYEQDVDLIATELAEILDLEKSWILEQAADTSMRYKVLAYRQTIDVTDKIREFINENDIVGVHMESTSQRYYPYGTLAAQVLGFTNAENSGAEGLEAYYESTLQGTAGEVVTTKGNYETEMLYSFEKYYEATDGQSLVLTIDTTAQYYLEKNMEAAIEKYDVQNGAFGIIMDVNTGEVLAMATLGSYDPNNYLEIYNTETKEELELLYEEAVQNEKDSEAYTEAMEKYNNAVVEARLSQWRNRVVSDGYEPGSTFKLVTLASALDSGAVTLENSFSCSGSAKIPGRSQILDCWKSAGHGTQTTAQCLQNSCNIGFAYIGLALGGEKLYDYVQALGLMEKTGIDLSGEGVGLFYDREMLADNDTYGTSYLTSTAFGQTFKITPIQLVRAVSAIVNGGYVLEPYIVSEVLDTDGNTVKKNSTTVLRQAISEETSKTMCELMESVVTDGTATNAQVAGYRIGGKTGTSEKVDQVDEYGNMVDDKIVSFVGVAPIDNPQYIVLVALDTPSRETGIYISGGVMAAPTVRDVFADILPYFGVNANYSEDEVSSVNVVMPNLTDFTESEAAEALKEQNLTYETVGDGDKVTDQIPSAGMELPGNSTVILYMGEEKPTEQVSVPNFVGMTLADASITATNAGLYLQTKGSANTGSTVSATGQDIEAGTMVDRGTTITVEFTDSSAQD